MLGRASVLNSTACRPVQDACCRSSREELRSLQQLTAETVIFSKVCLLVINMLLQPSSSSLLWNSLGVWECASRCELLWTPAAAVAQWIWAFISVSANFTAFQLLLMFWSCKGVRLGDGRTWKELGGGSSVKRPLVAAGKVFDVHLTSSESLYQSNCWK